ncbi:hypothetical protein ACNKHS_02325 [Shigella flexneri]
MTRRLSQQMNPQFRPMLMIAAGGAALIASVFCTADSVLRVIRDRQPEP